MTTTATTDRPTFSIRVFTSPVFSTLRMVTVGTLVAGIALGLIASHPLAFLALAILSPASLGAVRQGRRFNLTNDFLAVEAWFVPIAAIAALAFYLF